MACGGCRFHEQAVSAFVAPVPAINTKLQRKSLSHPTTPHATPPPPPGLLHVLASADGAAASFVHDPSGSTLGRARATETKMMLDGFDVPSTLLALAKENDVSRTNQPLATPPVHSLPPSTPSIHPPSIRWCLWHGQPVR